MSRALAAVLLSAALGLVAAAPAGAAPYTVYACETPQNVPAPIDAWSFKELPAGSNATRSSNQCPEGKAFSAILRAPATQGSQGRWTFSAPADTTVASYTIFRSARGNSRVVGDAYDYAMGYGLYEQARDNTLTIIEACADAPSCNAIGNQPLRRDAPANIVDVFAIAACFSGQCPATDENQARVNIQRAEMTLEDRSPPTFTGPVEGSLIQSVGELRGVKDFSFSAADKGGGLRSVVVEIDGVARANYTLDPNGGRCIEPFTYVVPCKLEASPSFQFDTATVPDGKHELRIIVRDVTDKNQAVFGPLGITTNNAPISRGAPNGSPPADRAVLTAGVVRARKSRTPPKPVRNLTTYYRASTRLVGRLTTPEGVPIANAAVAVITTNRNKGARAIYRGNVNTDAAGNYSWPIPPGPSRSFVVKYRAFERDTTDAAVAAAGLDVRAGIRLSVNDRSVREGRSVTFRGLLRGRPLPRRGKLLELQARDRGVWRTFSTVRASGRTGRFSKRYRFRPLGFSRTYRFRARLRSESSYPYLSGNSRTVSVRVRN